MKSPALILLLAVAASAGAQSRNLEEELRAKNGPAQAEWGGRFRVERPNEITRGRKSYRGVFVQALKTRKPLQLLNPFAPARHGHPEQNVTRDTVTHEVTGINLVSLSKSRR